MAENLNPERWLFVCTGNICRSPMAEEVARRLGPGTMVFSSAGTHAIPGNPATAAGVQVAAELGFDLSSHRATQLTGTVVAGADLILAMEEHHAAAARRFAPHATVELLDPAGAGIDDPYGGTAADYRSSYEAIVDAVRARLALGE
ncbi:MAG: low molecular weight phosphatase family protein [Acidimicrobiia bacterium]|nr:low molecular weight phosphatase family protein [Acidimicrobiia bacterium]MBT8218052.1 low molecular weight phosphatase family protein [Acidimicrobiia bacterium]NNF09354.1 low molecular weight phosphatase family protein [Acidimicrobiia bacterium]NNL71207.1 low molecular weight phosphatase family protein [Acidimicrobiia bacterium]